MSKKVAKTNAAVADMKPLNTVVKRELGKVERATAKAQGVVYDATTAIVDVLILHYAAPEAPNKVPEGGKKTALTREINRLTRLYSDAATAGKVGDEVSKHMKRHISNMLFQRTLPDTALENGKKLKQITNMGELQKVVSEAKAKHGHASAAAKKGPDQHRNDPPEGETANVTPTLSEGEAAARQWLGTALANEESRRWVYNYICEHTDWLIGDELRKEAEKKSQPSA